MNLRQTLAAASLLLASTATFATPAAWFLVNGDTFTAQFQITNTSNQNEQITSLSFVLPNGFVFDTFSSNPAVNQAKPFLSAVNPWLLDPTKSTLPVDDGTSLLLGFSAFDGFPNNQGTCLGDCQYAWSVDVDAVGATPANREVSVLSNQLFGAQISVTFSDNTVLSGVLGACTASAQIANRCSTTGIAAYWEAAGTVGGGGGGNKTPEPGSLALAGLALLGLGAAHRAKRR